MRLLTHETGRQEHFRYESALADTQIGTAGAVSSENTVRSTGIEGDLAENGGKSCQVPLEKGGPGR